MKINKLKDLYKIVGVNDDHLYLLWAKCEKCESYPLGLSRIGSKLNCRCQKCGEYFSRFCFSLTGMSYAFLEYENGKYKPSHYLFFFEEKHYRKQS